MKRRLWVPTRFVTINTHVGLGLDVEIPALLRKHHPHVVFLQEVKGSLEEYRDDYLVIREGTQATLYHKKRYELVEQLSWQYGGASEYDRFVLVGVVLDKWTKRVMRTSVLHPDPLGKGLNGANKSARLRHTNQAAAQLRPLRGRPVHEIVAMGGDANESVDISRVHPSLRRITVSYQLGQLGLFPASELANRKTGKLNIDDVWLRHASFLKVERWRSYDTRYRQLDHPIVITDTRIRRRPRWHKDVRKMKR